MRRGVGVAGLKKNAETSARFREKGGEVTQYQISQAREVLETFRSKLEEFSTKHRSEINNDPQLRYHFQKMCTTIGVDPLASKKGFWAEMLGLGSFYYELGVQIVAVCIATRPRNGGLMEITELLELLKKKRGKRAALVSADDVMRSIKKLKVLGDGYDIVVIQDRQYVQSIPVELNRDCVDVLAAAQERLGSVRKEDLRTSLGWSDIRTAAAVERMMIEGICWVDAVDESYWFPCMSLEG
eukprot:ANDGO_08549.mRNA.1 Vacuolar protein sorting-associated protein 22 homolog 1